MRAHASSHAVAGNGKFFNMLVAVTARYAVAATNRSKNPSAAGKRAALRPETAPLLRPSGADVCLHLAKSFHTATRYALSTA